MGKNLYRYFLFVLVLASCNLPQGFAPATGSLTATPLPGATDTLVPAVTVTIAPSPTSTVLAVAGATGTVTATSTPQATTTATETATPVGSPTVSNPTAVSKANSNCLYGPASAYMYVYGLRPGDKAEVRGRNYAATWLWVQPAGTSLFCWVSVSSVTLPLAVKSLKVVNPALPTNASVKPPTGVSATRSGSSVSIHWNAAPPAVGLGYLIEATICSKGNLVDVVATTTGLSYKLTDDKDCGQASYGQVRVQDKLGYSTAVKIAWP